MLYDVFIEVFLIIFGRKGGDRTRAFRNGWFPREAEVWSQKVLK